MAFPNAFDNNPFHRSPFGGGQPRAEYRRPLPEEQAEGMGKTLLRTGASGVGAVLSVLNKPHRALMGTLSGNPREALNILPLPTDTLGLTNPEHEVTGRDVLDYAGVTDKHDKGWGAWGAGLAADIATDPLTFMHLGTGRALTSSGQALSKAGGLKTLSRADRIAQGHSGLAAFGLPFKAPAKVIGTGPGAIWAANQLDKAGHAARYSPLGTRLGAWFDSNTAIPDITHPELQQSAKKVLPIRKELEDRARQQYRDLTKGIHGAMNATGAAPEKVLESIKELTGQTHTAMDPALFDAAAGAASLSRTMNAGQLSRAKKIGLPLKEYVDPFSAYNPRQAEAAVGKQSLGLKPTSTVPVGSSANMRRKDFLTGIPGGEPAINRWVSELAGQPINDVTDRIWKDFQEHVARRPTPLLPLEPEILQGLPAKANELAQWISDMPAGSYPKGYFAPDLAKVQAQRAAKSVRTETSGHVIHQFLADWSKPRAALPADQFIPLSQALKAVGLTTTPAKKSAGRLMEGALPTLAEKMGISTAPFLRGKIRKLREAIDQRGITPDQLKALTEHYKKWEAPNSVDNMMSLIDTPTNLFKNMAYAVWLPSHVRNLASGISSNIQEGAGLGAHMDAFRILRDTATADQVRRYFPNLPAGISDQAARDFAKGQAYQHASIFGGHNAATDISGGTQKANAPGTLSVSPIPGEAKVGVRKSRPRPAADNSFAPNNPRFDQEELLDQIDRDGWMQGDALHPASPTPVDPNFYEGLSDFVDEEDIGSWLHDHPAPGAPRPHRPPSDNSFAPNSPRFDQEELLGQADNSFAPNNPAFDQEEDISSWLQPLPRQKPVSPYGSFPGQLFGLVRKAMLGDKTAGVTPAWRGVHKQAGVFGNTVDQWGPLVAGREAGTGIENFVRMAEYLNEAKRGVSPAEIGNRVNRVHFDYQGLTPFERKVMKRAVPFYTFARKNLPLQLERSLGRPASISAQIRPFQGGKDQYTPEYLASDLHMPIGQAFTGPQGEQTQRYLTSLGLPVEEAFNRIKFSGGLPDLKKTAMAYAGSTNPLIKGPMEWLFGRQLFSGRDLADLRPTTIGSGFGLLDDDSAHLASQVLANTPATRFVSAFDKLADPRKPAWAKAMNLLSGARVSDVDTDKAQAIDQRKALEAILKKSPHLASHTNFYVRPDQAPNLTPDEVQKMRLYALYQANAKAAAERRRQVGGQ